MSMFNRRSIGKTFLKVLMAVVMFVVVVLALVAMIVFLPGVRDRNDSNVEVSHLVTIKNNMERLFMKPDGSYEGLNMAMANRSGVFPSSMNGGDFTAAAKVLAAWGSPVYLRTIPANSQQRFYVLEYHEVNATDCLGFVSGSAIHLDQIHVNRIPMFTSNTGAAMSAKEGGEFNPSEAARACASKKSSLVAITVHSPVPESKKTKRPQGGRF